MNRGPAHCTLRTVVKDHDRLILYVGPTGADKVDIAAVPPGFVGLNMPSVDPLAPLMKHGGSVHWLIQTIAGPKCSEWKFKSAHERRSRSGPTTEVEAELHRREWQLIEGERTFASFGAQYQRGSKDRAGSMLLFGPHFDSHPKRGGAPQHWGYRCAEDYHLVGVTDVAFRILTVQPEQLVAWHQDDEEKWFFDREACGAAARAASDALARDPNARPPGGLHVDCYDELHDPNVKE
jgi:hypothetical protein